MFNNRKNINFLGGQRILFLGVLCLLGFSLMGHAQRNKTAVNQPKQKSKVYLIKADRLKKDASNPDAQIVVGNVVFRHDSVYMYCDSACYYDKINSFEAFNNVRMEQGDTLFLYGDRLYYDGLSQIAQMRMNVKMENRTTTLLTDSLNYDRIYNLGYFFDGGTMMDDQNVLTSDWGEYSPGTKQSVFYYNVSLENPQFTMLSDTLKYNTANKIANIVGPSDIYSGESHIYSEKGYYNTQTGKADLYERSVLTNDGKQLVSDTLFYDRNSGVGEAFGNIVMNDTVHKNMMLGNYGWYNEKLKNAFVTHNAVAVDYSQVDSLFLHADTLSLDTYNLDTDSVYREVKAYHKVRFYRTDVQGVADSLVFSSKDSCLIMYKDPILWNKQQQLLGEQINIYMNDSTIDWAHIINQTLSAEQIPVDTTLFNQISGKEMKAFFEKGMMHKVEIDGSVRVVYYPMDSDSLLIGMNVSETSKLEIYLQNQQLERMVMSPKSNGTLFPMSQIPFDKSRLDNFVWFDYIRPLNKNDIFIWRGKRTEDLLKKNVRSPIVLPNHNLFDDNK